MEKRKIISLILSGVGIFIGYFLVNQFVFKAPSLDEKMMQMAGELNKNCPIMIDKDTRLDNSIALPGNAFLYNYTLINLTKDEIDTAVFNANLRPTILNTIKTSPDLKVFRANNIEMQYNYKDKQGVFIYKFIFQSKDYK